AGVRHQHSVYTRQAAVHAVRHRSGGERARAGARRASVLAQPARALPGQADSGTLRPFLITASSAGVIGALMLLPRLGGARYLPTVMRFASLALGPGSRSARACATKARVNAGCCARPTSPGTRTPRVPAERAPRARAGTQGNSTDA